MNEQPVDTADHRMASAGSVTWIRRNYTSVPAVSDLPKRLIGMDKRSYRHKGYTDRIEPAGAAYHGALIKVLTCSGSTLNPGPMVLEREMARR